MCGLNSGAVEALMIDTSSILRHKHSELAPCAILSNKGERVRNISHRQKKQIILKDMMHCSMNTNVAIIYRGD